MKNWGILCFILLMMGKENAIAEENLPLDRIRLPAGFRIELFARVENARSMAIDKNGTIYVGTREAGKVFAVADSKDGRR